MSRRRNALTLAVWLTPLMFGLVSAGPLIAAANPDAGSAATTTVTGASTPRNATTPHDTQAGQDQAAHDNQAGHDQADHGHRPRQGQAQALPVRRILRPPPAGDLARPRRPGRRRGATVRCRSV